MRLTAKPIRVFAMSQLFSIAFVAFPLYFLNFVVAVEFVLKNKRDFIVVSPQPEQKYRMLKIHVDLVSPAGFSGNMEIQLDVSVRCS